MYQQQQYHTGQGPFHQNIYLVRGLNGQQFYVDGYTLKPLPYNELIARGLIQAPIQAPNTSQVVRIQPSPQPQGPWQQSQSGQYLAPNANQIQRKSFSEAGESQNVTSISLAALAVRRKSSTSSRGENSHGARKNSRENTKRKSVSETRESQNIRSHSTNVTPGEHRSRRDNSERSSSLSRDEQRNRSKSPNKPLLGFDGLLTTCQRQPTTEQKNPEPGQVPVIGWDVGESNTQKSCRETGSNDKQKQKTNIIDSTKGIANEVKLETASGSGLPNTRPEITITNEDISQSQTTSKEIDLGQIKDIPPNQKNVEQQNDNDKQIVDFVNNRLSHIVITGPKESQENIKIVTRGPSNLNKGPGYISNGPASLNKGPIESTKGPSEITKGPGHLNKGPGNISLGPCDLNQGPLAFIHIPDSQLAKGPSAFCCGPSIFVRGPSLSIGSCKVTIGPTLSKGPASLSKGSLKQATMTV